MKMQRSRWRKQVILPSPQIRTPTIGVTKTLLFLFNPKSPAHEQ